MCSRSGPAFRCVLLLLVCCLSAGCSEIERTQAQSRVIANVQEADRQLNLGNEAKARQWFDRAIAISPDDASTYLGFDADGSGGVVWSLNQHNDWPDMVAYLSKAVANPKLSSTYELWNFLAQAQQSMGLIEAAKTSYQKELAVIDSVGTSKGEMLDPTDPGQRQLDRAGAEWGAGLQEQARADYTKVIQRFPQLAPTAENALAYSDAEANTDLKSAYSLAQAAVAYGRGNDYDDTDMGEIVDTLAWVEFRLHKYDDAARDEDEAVGDLPREPVLHYHLAEIYHALGDAQDAQIEIERAAALCPSDADTQTALRIIEPAAASVKKAS
jgi:Tfp pilus assembly protein PilF